MILRRVIEHFRKQEWTAVAIDFVIVVAGVFVGLQVSNWNAERAAQAEESRLTAQLLGDVRSAIEEKDEWIARLQRRLGDYESAVRAMQDEAAAPAWTDEQCAAVWTSHVIVFGGSSLVTLDEILATDGLGALSNRDLRKAILDYKAGRARIDSSYALVRDVFANLIDEHATAFPRTYVEGDDAAGLPIATRVDCKLELIRPDQTIRNKIISNLARTQAILNYAKDDADLLRRIEAALEEVAR